jgi:hypothetical protein
VRRLPVFGSFAHDAEGVLPAIEFSRLVFVGDFYYGGHFVERKADVGFGKSWPAFIQTFGNFGSGERHACPTQRLQDEALDSRHDPSVSQVRCQFQTLWKANGTNLSPDSWYDFHAKATPEG